MQKTFASAHILTISYKDEGKLHYFRVTTLLCRLNADRSPAAPTPHCAGLRTPFNGGVSRLELHGERFCPLFTQAARR